MPRKLLVALLVSTPIWSQETLTLRQAIDLALRSSPAALASEAAEKEAAARLGEARAGYLPRLSFSESLQRSNNPVFVFGSLLSQHQFTASNFDLGPLNRPDALNNYQSRLAVEQTLFDARQTSHGVEVARLAREIAGEDTRRSSADIVLAVMRSYFAVALAARNLEVAEQSLQSAQADLERAQRIHESGRSTEADVLSVRVHLAAMREQQIRAANDLAVARATLNDVLGVSLDREFQLTTPLEAAPEPPAAKIEDYRRLAAVQRPELRQGLLAQRLAREQQGVSSASWWPHVTFQGFVEADRQEVFAKAGSNWLASVNLRWNLWNGGATRSRIDQARFAEDRARALAQRADSAVNLEIRKAYLDLGSAGRRVEVATAAVAEAEEAHRIIQNRHQAGLTTVTELLRSETALASARSRRLAAIYDQRVAAAALEHAAGSLTAESPVVNPGANSGN